MELEIITGQAVISTPYITQSTQFNKNKTNIPQARSSTFLVLRDLITCGIIINVPATAAV